MPRMSDLQRLIDETACARRQAEDVLRSLLEVKALESAGGLGEPGKPPRPDLYRQVTGSSSIDRAIAAAKRSIETYDRILSEINAPAAAREP